MRAHDAMRLAAALLVLATGCEPTMAADAGPSDSLTDVPSIPNSSNYPRFLSWANIDTDGDGVGENYITSVKSQPCGDCYAYAVLALVESRWQIDNRAAVSLNLSEQNIHNCMKIPCDGAGDVWWMLDYVRDYGVMLEENMPSGIWLPICENCIGLAFSGLGLVSIRNVHFYLVKGYDTLPMPKEYSQRRDSLVAALQEGPVAVGVDAWYGYSNYNGVLYCDKEKIVGSGHTILVVGYLEHGAAFLVKNGHSEAS